MLFSNLFVYRYEPKTRYSLELRFQICKIYAPPSVVFSKKTEEPESQAETHSSEHTDDEDNSSDDERIHKFFSSEEEDCTESQPLNFVEAVSKKMADFISEDASAEEIICEISAFKFAKKESFENCLKGVVRGILQNVGAKPADHLRKWQRILQIFCQSNNTMMVLIEEMERIVKDCWLARHFSVLVSILYQNDVLDDDAILDWNEWTTEESLKEQMKPFLEFLLEE